MHKKKLDNLLKSCNEIEQKIIEVHRNLEMMQTMRPSEYSNPVDREQARESLDYTESEVIIALLEISKEARNMALKIDPEAIREFDWEN